jgi:hypothetical protein
VLPIVRAFPLKAGWPVVAVNIVRVQRVFLVLSGRD